MKNNLVFSQNVAYECKKSKNYKRWCISGSEIIVKWWITKSHKSTNLKICSSKRFMIEFADHSSFKLWMWLCEKCIWTDTKDRRYSIINSFTVYTGFFLKKNTIFCVRGVLFVISGFANPDFDVHCSFPEFCVCYWLMKPHFRWRSGGAFAVQIASILWIQSTT